jgi:hypothetical protein
VFTDDALREWMGLEPIANPFETKSVLGTTTVTAMTRFDTTDLLPARKLPLLVDSEDWTFLAGDVPPETRQFIARISQLRSFVS